MVKKLSKSLQKVQKVDKKLSKKFSNSETSRRRRRHSRRRRRRRGFVVPRPGTTLSHLVKIVRACESQPRPPQPYIRCRLAACVCPLSPVIYPKSIKNNRGFLKALFALLKTPPLKQRIINYLCHLMNRKRRLAKR
jgi:hypothetical protein